ncbi:MAG TPA: hypothetical protein VF942_06050 [Acidimicrobiales bacterium]
MIATSTAVRFGVAVVATSLGVLLTAQLAPAATTHRGAVSNPPAVSAPVKLPASAGLGEPSIAIDSAGRLFVTAPQGLGNITGSGSPIWTSTNGGASFASPVNPNGDPVSGGDTDLAVDASGDIYQVDVWLGNAAIALSTDHGASFIANQYGHLQPGDDRPWLTYSASDNTLYLTWDGFDGIHVAHSLPLTNPSLGLVFAQDVVAVPECILGGTNPCSTPPIRQCVCSPGGIAVDPHSGQVYVSYSKQNGPANGGGVGIASSTNGGLTWSYSSVPLSGSTGSAFDTEYNFDPIQVDNQGHLYVAWGEGQGIDTNNVATGGVAIKYSYSTNHGANWNTPTLVSTTTTTNVFPTLAVVAPGVVNIGYYGSTATGDPNSPKPANATWNVMLAKSGDALSAAPGFSPAIAVAGIHTGCIQVGGLASCSDRSLLDFFQLIVDHAGQANIMYTAGDATQGTALFFTKQ